MLDTGHLPVRSRWRATVDRAVKDTQVVRWKMSCFMYQKLKNFTSFVPEAVLVQWWRVCKSRPDLTMKCKAVIALVVGEHSLDSGRGKYTYNSKLCKLCNAYAEETIHHFLFECTGLKSHIIMLPPKVWEAISPVMVRCIACMTSEKQVQFILGEMGNTFVPEWSAIHQSIIVFVHGLYETRKNMLTCD